MMPPKSGHDAQTGSGRANPHYSTLSFWKSTAHQYNKPFLVEFAWLCFVTAGLLAWLALLMVDEHDSTLIMTGSHHQHYITIPLYIVLGILGLREWYIVLFPDHYVTFEQRLWLSDPRTSEKAHIAGFKAAHFTDGCIYLVAMATLSLVIHWKYDVPSHMGTMMVYGLAMLLVLILAGVGMFILEDHRTVTALEIDEHMAELESNKTRGESVLAEMERYSNRQSRQPKKDRYSGGGGSRGRDGL